MAVNASSTHTPTHAAAGSSAASALAIARRAASRTGDADDAADFASQLRQARADEPRRDDDAPSSSSSSADATKGDADTSPAKDATAHRADDGPPAAAHASTPDAAQDPAAPATPWTLDPALAALAQRAAASTADATSLAGRLSAKLAHGKAAATGLAGLSGLADAKGAATPGATDPKAALGAAEAQVRGLGAGDAGAGNAATGTKDSLAAFLPGVDGAPLDAAVAAQAAGAAAPGASLASADATLSGAAATPAQATLDMPLQSPAFAPALGRQVEVWMKDGVQNAEVQLNPLELGPIRVRIAIEGDTTRVEMAADAQATRDALQQALPQLSDALGQVGLSLGDAGVSDQPASGQPGREGGFGAFAEAARQGGSAAGDGRGEAGTSAADAAALARPARAPSRRGLLDTYA